jgi:hypothetical protein
MTYGLLVRRSAMSDDERSLRKPKPSGCLTRVLRSLFKNVAIMTVVHLARSVDELLKGSSDARGKPDE